MHNLFDTIPTLNHMIAAMSHIRLQAEIMDNKGRYSPVSENLKISQILNKNSEFSENILAQIYRRYITYPNVCVYKIKSLRALREIGKNPNFEAITYKDGMISDLYVVEDDEGYVDSNLSYHVEDDSNLGRKVLKQFEYIYIPPEPEKAMEASIAKKLDRVMYRRDTSTTIGKILGIQDELADEIIKPMPSNLRQIAIKKALNDTIIPLALYFRDQIEKGIGLPDGMRISLNLEDIESVEYAWDFDEKGREV